MVHGELADRMAPTGHILLRKHEITRTNGLTPMTGLYPVQAHRIGGLALVVDPCPERRLCHP